MQRVSRPSLKNNIKWIVKIELEDFLAEDAHRVMQRVRAIAPLLNRERMIPHS